MTRRTIKQKNIAIYPETAETPGGSLLRSHPNTLGEGQVYYYHRDHLGSTQSVTDGAGNIAQMVEYTPWGEVFVELKGDSVLTTPYLFNGKELDEETGLYYYGARYYDPKMSVWYGVDPLSNYNPLGNENHIDGEHNRGVFYQGNLNPYVYCYQNPIKFLDPNGEQVVAVHGTWSNNKTWKDPEGISHFASKKFDNKVFDFEFNWSGGNFPIYRSVAAKQLISYIKKIRKRTDSREPITLVGHSHGGNVCIEAINIMVDMKDFDKIKINLITINTPVRSDYQLNNKAQNRTEHINIFDPQDPVQAFGGKLLTIYFNTLFLLPSQKFPYGEYGPAGRQFKNAENIKVNHPQGLFGDFHNSHNRVKDWVDSE